MLEVVGCHAPEGVVEGPVGTHCVDKASLGYVFLSDGVHEVEDSDTPHYEQLHRYGMPLRRPSRGQRRYAYLTGLHIELHHEFLYILPEIVHALFGGSLSKRELRFSLLHLSPATSPIKDRHRKRDARIFLMHEMAERLADVLTRLRQSELHIEIGLHPCVGLSIGEIAFSLLDDTVVIFRIRTVA